MLMLMMKIPRWGGCGNVQDGGWWEEEHHILHWESPGQQKWMGSDEMVKSYGKWESPGEKEDDYAECDDDESDYE